MLGGMRILLLLLVPGLHLFAQSWDAVCRLQTSDRIRVLEIAGPEYKGTFGSCSGSAVVVRSGKGEVTVERAVVRRVQVRSGARRLRNVLIGAGIGVAIGALADQTMGAYIRNESMESSGVRAVTYVAPVAVFGGIGAAIGNWRTIYKR